MSPFDDIPDTRIFEDYSALKGLKKLDEAPINQQTALSALGSVVDILEKGKVPPVVFLSGPTGSGKTYLTKHCFEWERKPNTSNSTMSTVWIKQMNQTKSGNALRLLCRCFDDQLPSPTDAPSLRCKPSEEVVRGKIQERLQTLSTPVIVIIDEFTLTAPVESIIREVLLPLRNEATEPPLGLAFLSYKERYEKLAGCFVDGGPIHLELNCYSQEETARILTQKAAVAFKSGAVSEGILELCAKIAVERNATPRGAQELLLRAGAEASLTGESTVSERHVQKAVAEIDSTTWS
ncbi:MULTISPECIES: AAA family ATPase [Haloferax]|uniref:AAA family ATPase n=1 Tax=Haloferax marinum TaxID=2666143 RepID=A0A6A8GAA4_9EURY|nr:MULTISPECIES: AAA family ATPase [Haloferax]KAB1198126.1 AAA family ATPase [Haloferax sp. CBA1150]MRW97203.1 AAA family ATPase [Haloferax marinum]